MKPIRLLALTGLPALFRRLNRNRVAVLMYHGVLPDQDTLAKDAWLHVRTSEFRWQMAFLKRHFNVVRLSDALAGNIGDGQRPAAVITFDDGYANNAQHALPILSELGLPATIYVATGYLNTRRWFWWDKLHYAHQQHGFTYPEAWIGQLKALPPNQIDDAVNAALAEAGVALPDAAPDSFCAMNHAELQAVLASGLIDIGSHTHGHEIIERLGPEALQKTLDDSLATLRQQGVETRLFAAPNGDYVDSQIAQLQACGFASCAATHEGLWDAPQQPFRIPRLGIGRGANRDWFALMTSGALPWLRQLKGAGRHGSY